MTGCGWGCTARHDFDATSKGMNGEMSRYVNDNGTNWISSPHSYRFYYRCLTTTILSPCPFLFCNITCLRLSVMQNNQHYDMFIYLPPKDPCSTQPCSNVPTRSIVTPSLRSRSESHVTQRTQPRSGYTPGTWWWYSQGIVLTRAGKKERRYGRGYTADCISSLTLSFYMCKTLVLRSTSRLRDKLTGLV